MVSVQTMQRCSNMQSLPPVKYTPDSSAMKSERPIPTGARNVPLCFSAASRKMVITSCAVKNISMTALTLARAESSAERHTHTILAQPKYLHQEW